MWHWSHVYGKKSQGSALWEVKDTLVYNLQYYWIASIPLFASMILNPFWDKMNYKKLLMKGSSSTIIIWGQPQLEVVKGGIILFGDVSSLISYSSDCSSSIIEIL